MYKLFLPAFLFATLIIPIDQAYATKACGGPKVEIATKDKTSCLPKKVCTILGMIAEKHGKVSIVSAYRPERENARRGGAKKSMHIQCRAVDFLIPKRSTIAEQRALASTMVNIRKKVGQMRYNVYCTGRAHVDDSGLKDGYDTCIYGKKAVAKSTKKFQRKTTKRRK